MGLLSRKDKSTVVNGAIDLAKGIRSMVDDSKFTEEEAARMNIGAAEAIAQFAKDTASENTERSKARRTIAIFYIYFFCALSIAVIVLRKFDPEWAAFAKDVISTFNLGGAFIAVMGFFFSAHLIRQYTGKK